MQIKTAMVYHLTHSKITIIKKKTKGKFWRVCGKKGTILHIAATVENCMEVSQNTKNRITTHEPAIPLLGIHLKKNKNTNSKRYMHPSVHSGIIYNCQDMEAT